ncbi:hypothetical protein Pelo_18155 [Pelomyxa schiedti]|nr:hypothetical protein Pelo_18155 [Pelomyxa schiedti]
MLIQRQPSCCCVVQLKKFADAADLAPLVVDGKTLHPENLMTVPLHKWPALSIVPPESGAKGPTPKRRRPNVLPQLPPSPPSTGLPVTGGRQQQQQQQPATTKPTATTRMVPPTQAQIERMVQLRTTRKRRASSSAVVTVPTPYEIISKKIMYEGELLCRELCDWKSGIMEQTKAEVGAEYRERHSALFMPESLPFEIDNIGQRRQKIVEQLTKASQFITEVIVWFQAALDALHSTLGTAASPVTALPQLSTAPRLTLVPATPTSSSSGEAVEPPVTIMGRFVGGIVRQIFNAEDGVGDLGVDKDLDELSVEQLTAIEQYFEIKVGFSSLGDSLDTQFQGAAVALRKIGGQLDAQAELIPIVIANCQQIMAQIENVLGPYRESVSKLAHLKQMLPPKFRNPHHT